MNFRDVHCVWCKRKTGPVEDCIRCPRFRRYELGEDIVLDAGAFCEHCVNMGDAGLTVFCETNRKLQAGSDEPFDCYKFFLDVQAQAGTQAHVVTVFLWHQGRVCLVRRSAHVGTYQGLWSGISGYLEGDPAEHFKVELREETSLEPSEYTLLRRAEPVAVRDEKASRMWFVHPFLCEVRDPSRIRLDWENTELKWVEPAAMRDMDTVPGLFHVYERVSRAPLKEEVRLFVKQLAEDRINGARQLACQALDFLVKMSRLSNAASASVLLNDLFYAAQEIGTARPSMNIIATSLDMMLRDARNFISLSLEEAREKITVLIRSSIRDMDAAIDRAVAHLPGIIPQGAAVLMHSYSSSLLRALPVLKKKQCTLVVTESRPGFEGRAIAQAASELGIHVRLIVDAAAAHHLEGVDLVLMGCDSIEQDGSVINKTGSSLIAMAATFLGKKVYFIGEVRKICSSRSRVELEEYEASEVWDEQPEGIEIRNVYFDRTPPGCTTGIILESGVVEPGKIGVIAQSMMAAGSA